jgi:inosose dehydratase
MQPITRWHRSVIGGLVLGLRAACVWRRRHTSDLEKYGSRVGYTHIKDVDGEILQTSHEQGWSSLQALRSFIFTPLGEGVVNIPAVIRALRSHRYEGWLVIEQDTTPEDPTAIGRKNRLYLEGLLQSES